MDYNEIIEALILIRDICACNSCIECPFRSDTDTCCIIGKGTPSYWEVNEDFNWRSFK